MKNIITGLMICCFLISKAQTNKEPNLGTMVQPVLDEYVFKDPNWFIWGGSVVKDKDQKYHMLYSRWPKSTGYSGWVTDSEVAYAIADQAEGPYRHVKVALKRRGNTYWDGMTTHNPNIILKDGKYYLYYMGTTGTGSKGNKNWWNYRNKQRIGVAVADHPSGPWKRFDKPVLDVSTKPEAFDGLMTSNPGVTFNDKGQMLMVYKAVEKTKNPHGGKVRFLAAFADNPTGPFVKYDKPIFTVKNSEDSHMLAEDPYIWFQNKKYYAIVRDVIGKFTGDEGALALMESNNGKEWKAAKYPKVLDSKFLFASGRLSGTKLERPQLLIEDGIPKFLFGGTGITGNKPKGTCNVRIKLTSLIRNNLASTGTVKVSSFQENQKGKLAIDGNKNTKWISTNKEPSKWIRVVLPGATEIKEIKINLQDTSKQPIKNYAIQTFLNGTWRNIVNRKENKTSNIEEKFKKAILTDRIRISIPSETAVVINELEIYGVQYANKSLAPTKKILVNQSGYNLNKPKRFTAPSTSNGSSFSIQNKRTKKTAFSGTIRNHIGDFSKFNPLSKDEFIVTIDTLTSFPFRIGPNWLERVTYRNMIDFMNGARHYTGTTNKIRPLSWAWRDGDFFNWSLQSLTAQFLSNPAAYIRMKEKMTYQSNSSFPDNYKNKWGALAPYKKGTPDIVKLIHWDVDVKLTQQLEHEMQKAELSYFLNAYSNLKQWLPKQNYTIVYNYLKKNWDKATVEKRSTTQYDQSPEHNLLALKTKMGTNKGELPPGHSVIPNLMMFEEAKKNNEPDAQKYFDAAYNQTSWMISNLDWNDPLTTKGQRMSEHITLRALAYFYNEYPNKIPAGLYIKIEDWSKKMISRSQNMWDFRKYTDNGDWIPAGWNETGNTLGFPACALAAMSVLKDDNLKNKLNLLVWSHFDDAFGRNPTGRHFSYDGAKEIEGVDLGWYSTHHGGVGLLEEVPFVFDGSPKTNHYPNHPEIGNLGWTEGWVQHNTAFNMSMAYLANYETSIELSTLKKNKIKIRLKAPINFYEDQIESLNIQVKCSNGDSITVTLQEESPYSEYLSTVIKIKKRKINLTDNTLQIKKGDTIYASYGLGYLKKKAQLVL